MSSDAPKAPTTRYTYERAVLARRIEFILIGIGGVFIILGWGIGHQEWARALGWLFTGIGFAIEMVYGRLLKPAPRTSGAGQPAPTASSASEPAPAADSAATSGSGAGSETHRGDESGL